MLDDFGSSEGHTDAVLLTPVRGPSIGVAKLERGGSLTIGRSSVCGLRLEDTAVSRHHARIDWKDDAPSVVDLGSRHGVLLNGVKQTPGEPVSLRPGDRVSINPWTFRIVRSGEAREGSTLLTGDHEQDSSFTERAPLADSMDSRRLRLLMETAETIHSAPDEAAVFASSSRALLDGGTFQCARIVRPVDLFERVELLASCSAAGATETPVSRTLLRAAQSGEAVRLRDRAEAAQAVSLADSSVVSAVCVPIIVGGVPDAYAYLDRTAGSSDESSEAVAYCASVAQLTGLALANLRRNELELERARTQRDIEAAAIAQRRLTPPEAGRVAGLVYRAELRPGRGVGGDLFGVVELQCGRGLVMLGDVSGKGIGAAITMAGVLSHALAIASMTSDPAEIVGATNRFACEHTTEAAFVTMFLAVIDPASGEARCCDAGHGLAVVVDEGEPRLLRAGGGLPLGIDPNAAYESSVVTGARMTLLSDGVIEQTDLEGQQFGIARVIELIGQAQSVEADVRSIFDALAGFAVGGPFADDVTVLSVALEPGG